MTPRSRLGTLLVVLLLTNGGAQAQHRWNDKPRHWYTDWKWWVGEAAIAGIRFADAHSTALARSRCAGCIETNPIIGKHPGNGDIIALSSVGFGIETALHIASSVHCPDVNWDSRPWRIACDALMPGIDAAISVPDIVHNYSLASQSKSVSLTSSSTVMFGQAQFRRAARARGQAWVVAPRREKPLLPPKWFPGCGHNLKLCLAPSLPIAATSKVNLALR